MRTLMLSSIGVLFCVLFISADCPSTETIDECKNHFLTSGGRYLKTFEVDPEKGKKGKGVEYSYIFTKGKFYFMSVCGDKMYVNLYDKQRRLVATSYDTRTNKFYPAMNFKCNSTGIYYFQYQYAEGVDKNCGVSVLGWK